MLILAAGAGPTLAEDTWAYLILFGPVVGTIATGLVLQTPVTPSSVFFGRQGWRAVWRWFVVPYRVPLVTPIAFAVGEYLGAGLSMASAEPRCLGLLLFGDTAALGWYFPLAGVLIGGLVGWVGIPLVVMPVKVAAAVPRLWRSDRTEAVRCLAFVVVLLGIWLTCGAHVASPTVDEDSRLQLLLEEINLLVGQAPADTPGWVPWLARAGALCLVAAGITIWRSKSGGRADSSPPRNDGPDQPDRARS